ncbi:MAG TPA: AMP-binding protein [Fibrobacteria bacterium]|nr:AMP-binding protein [Fibrobacteria bacterium]
MTSSRPTASDPEPWYATNIAEVFREASKAAPDRTAIAWDGEDVSYARLASIAQCIREKIAAEDLVVGILSHRCPLTYAAVQGVLASGAAFVPLHPTTPGPGLARIATQCGLRTIVVGEECAKGLVALLESHRGPLRIVTHGASAILRDIAKLHPHAELVESRTDDHLDLAPADPPRDGTAYIIFTTGSTGEPKGVRVLHRNAARFLESFAETLPMGPTDRVSELCDLTFDMTVQDQLSAWLAKATLVVFPDRFILKPLEFARAKGLTVWSSGPATPAMLEAFGMARPNALPDLRISIFGGEKLTWSTYRSWRSVAPNSLIVNGYGLTETSIALSFFKIPPDFREQDCIQGALPMGRPWSTQRFEIRRPDGSICDPGETGMLWFCGSQVVPGYLDPVKTAERFVERDGEIWFRTGDLVFEGPDGNLYFGGRKDLQVKVMGYMVELGEIESAIGRASGSPWALVEIASPRGIEEIVCVLPSRFAAKKREIRDAVSEMLEPYMIPKSWKFFDDIPLNTSGKVDRAKLRARLDAPSTEPNPSVQAGSPKP